MSTKPLLSLALLLLLVVPNSHHVLSTPNSILDWATPVATLDRLQLPSNALGPVISAFDSSGVGPYTSVNNGRILKWSGPSTGFVRFAVTSENWSEQLCDSVDMNLDTSCGRPIGIDFYNKTDTLYIADAYYNLRSVERDGGTATLLASSAGGVPLGFTNSVEVDQDTGVVYFTTVSNRYQLKDIQQAIRSNDSSGRLMKYDPANKQVTVVLDNLGGPAGPALSENGDFILVPENFKFRIQRYWLKGPKANTSEIFYTSQGSPDRITRNADADFWLAMSIREKQATIPLGILLGQDGQVLKALNFATANMSVPISNVEEYNGKLYVSSLRSDYIGVTTSTTG